MPRTPTQEVHAQSIGAKSEVILGESGAIETGQPGDPNANTHEGFSHAEPDLTPGEEANTNANAPMHPEDMGPNVLP